MPPLPKIIAIVGPTAGGKTVLAIDLAARFNGEIVSADSRQIYRGMDIGTAKPTAAERAAVPHHLIDIRDPGEEYTVADYRRDAIAAIRGVLSRGCVPFLVGGTGLYVRAVTENMDIPAVAADPALRAAIEREIAEEGLAAVFAKLVALDPDAERAVDGKNPRRVVRALEVARATGQPFTAQRKTLPPLFETLELGIDPPPDILRERIVRRVRGMFRDDALIDEVKDLTARCGADAPAMNAIGYRETAGYLAGDFTKEETIAAVILNTVHYAKRQRTWFRKDHSVRWLTDPEREAPELIASFLSAQSAQ